MCAIHSIRYLKEADFHVEGFFYNPNIHPEKEYLRRADVAKSVAEIENIPLSFGMYDVPLWMKECSKFADEPEGKSRCKACYRLRLEKTHEYMKERGFDCFITTLTISPHKDSSTVMQIAQDISKDSFLSIDFKKQNGFLKTMELAKKYNLYRQSYCGCIYSNKNKK